MPHNELEMNAIQFYKNENWSAFFDAFNMLCGGIRLDIRQVPRYVLEAPDVKLKILLYCARILKNHIKIPSQNALPAEDEAVLKDHSVTQYTSKPQVNLEISSKYYDKNFKHLCLSVKTSAALFPRLLAELENQNLSTIRSCEIFNVWLDEKNPTPEIFFRNLRGRELKDIRNAYLVINKRVNGAGIISFLDYIDEKGTRFRSGDLKMGPCLGGIHGGALLNCYDAVNILGVSDTRLDFADIDWLVARSILAPEAYVDSQEHTYYLFLLDTEEPENLLRFSALMSALSAMHPGESTNDLFCHMKYLYFCKPYSKSCEQVIDEQARKNFKPIEEWIEYHYTKIFSGRLNDDNIEQLFRTLLAVSQENPYYTNAQEKLMDLHVLGSSSGEALFSCAYLAQNDVALHLFNELCGLPFLGAEEQHSSALDILLYAASVIKPTILAHPDLQSTYIEQQPGDCGYSYWGFWKRGGVTQEPTLARILGFQR